MAPPRKTAPRNVAGLAVRGHRMDDLLVEAQRGESKKYGERTPIRLERSPPCKSGAAALRPSLEHFRRDSVGSFPSGLIPRNLLRLCSGRKNHSGELFHFPKLNIVEIDIPTAQSENNDLYEFCAFVEVIALDFC